MFLAQPSAQEMQNIYKFRKYLQLMVQCYIDVRCLQSEVVHQQTRGTPDCWGPVQLRTVRGTPDCWGPVQLRTEEVVHDSWGLLSQVLETEM